MTEKLTLYGLIFAAGIAVGTWGRGLVSHGHDNTTKVEVKHEPIPKALTKPDVELPNPDELVVYDGLRKENQELRGEAQRLRAEYQEAITALSNHAAGPVVGSGGQVPSLSTVCTRALESRARVGLSPIFQLNAGINVLLAMFAREQQREAEFAENRRFGLLPIDVATSNPVIEITRSKTVLNWWDPLEAHWLRSTYRHPYNRQPWLYAGAGTIINHGGLSYGIAASIDVHAAGRLRVSADGLLDAFDPDNSAALVTAQLGF